MENAPIVYFAYKRPEHTRKTLESISANPEARNTKLYIFLDGPPEDADEIVLQSIEETRKVVREKLWCGNVQIEESDINRGCDISMIEGISRVVDSHDRVIVLEDDLEVSTKYLSFMNRCLDEYENEPRIKSISGFMYPIDTRGFPDVFCGAFLNSWGFGTWKNKWKSYNPNVVELVEFIEENELIERFNLGSDLYFGWLKNLINRTDSYDIIWYASVLASRGFVLYPRNSFVRNLGFDLSGVHNFYNYENPSFLNQPLCEEDLEIHTGIDEYLPAVEIMTRSYEKIWGEN